MPVPHSADRARAAVMTISEASGCTSDYRAAVDTVLRAVFPCDLLLYNEIDLASGEVRLTGSGYVPPPDLPPRLLAVADEHPIMVHYTGAVDDPAPIRMSDLISLRSFRRTQTYAEIFRPLGARHQLAVLTDRGGPAGGRAWAMNRSSRDFTEDEAETARLLRPALVLLDELARDSRAADLVETPAAHGLAGPALTPREREVLQLLARGWTAAHIGHALRISRATVCKHLEHVYDKLGAHDRLVAVDRARAFGLLAGPSRTAARAVGS